MTRRRSRPLCPLGCIDGYVPDPETGERQPCPYCQATRLAAMERAREACGPRPATQPPDPPDTRAARLRRNAQQRGLTI